MIIVIIIAALVLGIAFFQVVQGLYTALINAILAVLCAAFALSYYEPLAEALFYGSGYAHYGDAASLVLLFAVPLLVLRFLYDHFLVPGNVVFGPWADRIGGGILGLFYGTILAGILALSLQMLPFGQTVLSWRTHDEKLQVDQQLAPFYPDRFVLGMARVFSTGSLSAGPNSAFDRVHKDYRRTMFAFRNTALRNARTSTPPDALTIRGAWKPDPTSARWVAGVPEDSLLSERQNLNSQVLVVRTGVDEQARDETHHWFRLPATHFVLVSKTGNKYYPVAYLAFGAGELKRNEPEVKKWLVIEDSAREETRRSRRRRDEDDEDEGGRGGPGRANLIVLREWKTEGGPKTLHIDWVYRLPEGEEPAYMMFRRIAKAQIGKVEEGQPPVDGALQHNADIERAERRRREARNRNR